MRAKTRFLPVAVFSLAATAIVLPHVRLTNPSTGAPLFWSNPAVGIVINSTGSDDILDGSHETSLRMAIEEWNAIPGTSASLVEDASAAAQARTDWQSSSIHLMFFDENNSSGFFPGGSQTVAVTPVWFFAGGNISDADVLFNGSGFGFTTSGVFGRYDVQDVGTHELGHLLGLDHSGWAGASMYPYVDPTVILHRSLSEDEVAGLRQAYPSGPFAVITGSIQRASDGSPVSGAHVVAQDGDGRPAASILTDASGNYTLNSIGPGTYNVYVVPLDAPVAEFNLGGGFSGLIDTDFEPGIHPATVVIVGTETVNLGALSVAGDVSINLGTNSDRYPVRVIEGMSQTVTLRGTSLFAPATLLASDPDLIIGTPMWFGSQVSFQVTVPAGEAPGHVDLMVTNGAGQVSMLPAGLEITPPSPTVTNVTPGSGTVAGGTVVTITGTNFNTGARIVIGDQIYTDGIGGTSILSPTTILLTTQPTVAGLHDVVVLDTSGVEGRMSGVFQAASLPTVATVFPVSGDMLGGTEVVITGQELLPSAMVRVNGIDQGPITHESNQVIRFTTTAGAVGPQLLEVENPGGWIATSAFAYATPPDPSVTSVAPGSGDTAGGQTVTVTGTNFTSSHEVYFGADPNTGAGGVQAASVTLVSATELSVETPAFGGAGMVSVLVSEPATGQAGVLGAAFTYQSPGDIGGGCYMVPVNGPFRPGPALLASWWLVLVFVVLGARALRRPATA